MSIHHVPNLGSRITVSFICTFPYDLAQGPLKYCGINILNLHTKQSIAHIHMLLKFSNQPQDLTRFILRAMGESMRLELGLCRQLFEVPMILQDVITDSWMKHTWLATRQVDIHVQIEIPDFPLNRHGDKELVRSFLQHGFCQPQLSSLHRCRMHLHVLQLSDLTTGNGDRLLTTNWHKIFPIMSEYQWPNAAKPSQSDWNMWDIALATVFQVGHNGCLALPLGNYFQENKNGWYYDTLENALWHRDGNQWRRHGNIPSCSRTQKFHGHGKSGIPAHSLRWATVQERKMAIMLTGSGSIDAA